MLNEEKLKNRVRKMCAAAIKFFHVERFELTSANELAWKPQTVQERKQQNSESSVHTRGDGEM